MKQKHDLLILQRSPDLPDGIRESFQSKGFLTRVISEESELPKAIKDLKEPIILAYMGTAKNEVARTAGKLAEITAAHTLPLIYVSVDADKFESYLNQHFVLATTLNVPCSNADILEAVLYISRYYEKFKSQAQPSAAETPEVDTKVEKISPPGAPSEETPSHSLYRDFKSIPELVFNQLSKLKIHERTLGGSTYSVLSDLKKLSVRSYYPTDMRVSKVIDEYPKKFNRWSLGHIQRTAFLSDLLFEALDVPADLKEQGRAAALLYSWSFLSEGRDLLRKDYLTARTSSFRKDLCSKIKDSAMRVATDLGLPGAGNIVACFARFIGRESAVSDNQAEIVASAIMAADLVDRICYRSGFFNPGSAYSLLSRIKSETIRDIHPLVLCCVIKVLAEAISHSAHHLSIPSKAKRDPNLRAKAREIFEQEVGADEIKVAITSLSPGMRLSRPVFTYDGKEILTGDLTLDQDLIWRIWQLASIRPLNGPVVIFSDA